jgi:BNR repeat protein
MKYSLGIILIIVLASCTMTKREKKSKNDFEDLVNQLESPAQEGSEEPYLFTDSENKVYLSWIEVKDELKHLKYSTLNNDNWSDPKIIITGSNWFVNWADYPVISVNDKDNLMAHFLMKTGGESYYYDIHTLFSTDGGGTWSEPRVLHDDGKQAEHGFVTIVPYKENFFATWLDGRNTVTGKDEGQNTDHDNPGPMTIRAAIVSPAGEKLEEWELDDRTCDCCQTSAAITANGPVVVYRNRSQEEVRDMSIVRWVDGSWSDPQIIFADDWEIAGCPVNGPKVSAIGNNLAVAWFTASEGKAKVNLVFSKDGGESFSRPVRIDEDNAIGRVDVELIDEETAIVSWMEGPAIKVVKAKSTGKEGESITIASSSESRASGFPQITRSGNKLIFAWTDSESQQVKTAYLDI